MYKYVYPCQYKNIYKITASTHDQATTKRELRDGVLVKPPGGSKPTNLGRFDRVLSYAASDVKGDLTVLVLGGSMTAGRMDSATPINHSSCFNGLKPYYEIQTWSRNSPPEKNTKQIPQCFAPSTVNVDCKPCAYAARLEYWLKKAYPHRRVRVLNLAVGGEGTTACLGRIGGVLKGMNISHKIDVAIINYVDNDR